MKISGLLIKGNGYIYIYIVRYLYISLYKRRSVFLLWSFSNDVLRGEEILSQCSFVDDVEDREVCDQDKFEDQFDRIIIGDQLRLIGCIDQRLQQDVESAERLHRGGDEIGKRTGDFVQPRSVVV